MDAYELAEKVRRIWMENYDMNSGSITKTGRDIRVMVDGKPVESVEFKDGRIELKVKND